MPIPVDPPIPEHGGCAHCGGPRPKPAERSKYRSKQSAEQGIPTSRKPGQDAQALEQAKQDPFCCTECCRAFHNVPIIKVEGIGRTYTVSRWTRKQDRAHHHEPRQPSPRPGRTCTACGCPVDEQTRGCRTCAGRHAGRRHLQRQRAAGAAARLAGESALVAGTSGRRALAHATEEE